MTPTPAATTDAEVVKQARRAALINLNTLPGCVVGLEDKAGALRSLRDEMSEGYRSWLDDIAGTMETAAKTINGSLAATPPSSAPALEGLNDAVVEITEAAIMCLDANEDNNAQLQAFERAILPVLTALATSTGDTPGSTQLSSSPPSSTETPDRIKSGDTPAALRARARQPIEQRDAP